MSFSSGEPDVIQLYEGGDGAVVGESTVMVGVEQVIGNKLLEHLVEHYILDQFTHLWNMGYRAIVLAFIFVAFLEVWVD